MRTPDWNELMSLYAAVGWTNYTDNAGDAPRRIHHAFTLHFGGV